MIDQRFMNQLAADMREPEEPVEEVLLAAGPVTSDVNMPFVGTRLNVPRAGQPQPTVQDRERTAVGLLDSLAGALRGAAAQTLGLPGDIRSIIDMIAQEGAEKYLGQRSFATTEEILQDTSVRVPGTNINVPFPPVLGADVPRREERQPTVETAQEVGTFLPAPGIPEAVVRGGRLVGRAVQATKNMPTKNTIKDATGAEIEIPKAPKVETKAFKNWFGESKVTDDTGKPLVMYHGTGGDFEQFRRSFRGAIFVTPDPAFAETFTGLVRGVGKGGKEFIDEQGMTPNIMPLYVKASNPFDYENPDHVAKIVEHLKKTRQFEGVTADWFEGGKWDKIEDRDVQKAIKDLGYDSFYVSEGGIKNLGVYDPRQVKSATGNVGTFDPSDPSIVRGVAVGGGGGAVATQEENK